MSGGPIGTEDDDEHCRRGRTKLAGPDNTECSEKIGKGASQTALLVEVANSGIHWMEPRDLGRRSFDPTINSTSGRGGWPGDMLVRRMSHSRMVRFVACRQTPRPRSLRRCLRPTGPMMVLSATEF